MGIHSFASRYSHKELVTGDLTFSVVSGEPVQVRGMVFDNGTGTSIHININDAAGVDIFHINVPACSSFEMSIPFLADKGLQITSDFGGIDVTVFHNSPGN